MKPHAVSADTDGVMPTKSGSIVVEPWVFAHVHLRCRTKLLKPVFKLSLLIQIERALGLDRTIDWVSPSDELSLQQDAPI